MTLSAVILTRDDRLFVPDYLAPLLESPHVRVAALLLDRRPSPHLKGRDILALCPWWRWPRLAWLAVLARLPGLSAWAGLPGERRISRLAARQGIPVFSLTSSADPNLVARLRTLAPDLILSIANSHILPPPVLECAKVAALNSHGSLLPAYKGILTGFWLLANGEAQGGVTIHHMDETVDGGAIVGQCSIAIGPDETIVSYYRKVATHGGRLWAEVVAAFDRGEVAPLVTGAGGACYGRPDGPAIRRFRALGRSFI